MSEKTPTLKRAAQWAAFTVGGGVALTFAMAGSAGADEIVVQDADVVNAGAAVANSGGNVAVGNASQNAAVNGQAAVGLLASNNSSASNQSNGTATIVTGDAKAVGNQSTTEVTQAQTGDGGPGLTLVVQDSDVTNAGLAAANSGGNAAVGNASGNLAVNGQLAVGALASNNGQASNESDGTASITTGNADATGNQSATKVAQHAAAGDDPGLAILVQDSDVLNLGVAVANSGGNLALGNVSGNLAANLQGAFGLIAANNGGASNKSDGTASITTGNATATGNKSLTDVEQVVTGDPGGLALVIQSAPVVNAGFGAANSGLNLGLGNGSLNAAILAQVSFGLLASNTGTADNLSDGFAFVLTGSATGTGNESATTTKQTA